MDGLQDEAKRVDERAARQAQVSGEGAAVGGAGNEKAAPAAADEGVARARADYEATLKERDERIAELEYEIAESAKTAEGAEERVGFELQLAGARNVKAARAVLPDHDNDVEKLKAAEPWLFSASSAPAPAGATDLPNTGTATDEGTTMRRWRGIAGLPEDKE